MRYYDPHLKQLIYIEQSATPKFWDTWWSKEGINTSILNNRFDFLVLPTTKKYLPLSTWILEGGCGTGKFVYSLTQAGYRCIGIDSAKQTIKSIKKIFPHLNVIVGDVRQLPFPDNHFDGYWSIGVIEHLYKNYLAITEEMTRVIKPNGYLFLTFPYMSPLRNLKAYFHLYPIKQTNKTPKKFYQFSLNHHHVIKKCEELGLQLIEEKPFDGFKGFRDEVTLLNGLLNPISDYSTKNIVIGGIRFLISKLTESFASHSILLVFRKNPI